MSQLVDFYRGEGTNPEGRSLIDIWAWPDDDLEAVHDFIQWLFPLPEPSRFNPDAPLLTEEDIGAFRSGPLLQANLMKSFERILGFLGLASTADGKVAEGDNFLARIPGSDCGHLRVRPTSPPFAAPLTSSPSRSAC
jgi:hypothetical protein